MASERPAQPVSQGDYLLWREVDRIDHRLDGLDSKLSNLDQHGSRGLAGLHIEVANLRTDLAQLRTDMVGHETQHLTEARDRATARRWGVALLVTSLLALIAPLYPLILLHPRP